MADKIFTPIFGTVARVVRLDACGAAVSGGTGMVVFDGFIKVERKPQYDAGAEFVIKNARGTLCVNRKRPDRLKRINIGITLCEVDPEGLELMTAARLLKSATDSTGNAFSEDENSANWQFEVWQEVDEGACVSGVQEYVQHLFPFVENGMLGDTVIEEAPSQWVVNANTRKNPLFKDPFGQWKNNEAVGAKDHHLYRRTTVAPPAASVGYQNLVLAS